MSVLTIAHLYPLEMNTYGDSGNVIALQKRLQWRGYQVNVEEVHPGQAFDFHKSDIVFGGGDRTLVNGASATIWPSAAMTSGRPQLTVCPC